MNAGLSWRRLTMPEAYAAMVALVAAATLIRLAIDPFVTGTQFPTYFLAAILCTFFGGVCIGLLSVALSTLSAWYFLPTGQMFSFAFVPGEAFSLVAFAVVAGMMVYIIGSLQTANLTIGEGLTREAALTERARIADQLRLWSDVFHNAAFGIAIVDPVSNAIRFANEAYAAMQGMSVGELQGLSVLDMYPPAERERIAELQVTSDRDGQADYEADRIRKDGSIFPAYVHTTSVRGADGEVRYRIATLRDITTQRQLIDELRLWSDVFHNAAFSISVSDPQTSVIRFANEAYAVTHGMSVGEVQGLSSFDLYPTAERERIAGLHATSDRMGEVDYEADRIHKDGSIFPAYVHTTSVRGANGEVRYRIGTVEDITIRRRMIDELRIWSDVFNNSAYGIATADPMSNIIRISNNAFASMHGLRLDEVQGRNLLDLYAPAERGRYATLRATADQTGSGDLEADRIRKDGSIFPARIHASTIRAENGAAVQLVAIVQEITAERQLRAELDQARRLETVGQLTAGIAHDFNNLLQGIMANLELVDDDIDVPLTTREYVGSAVRLAEQCGELTSSLLSFSRKQLLSPKAVALDEFLNNFQRLLSRTLDPRIRIDVVVEPALAPVWIDVGHLQSALLNLAINARDAMPSGGSLRIEALTDGVAASSAVQDTSADGLVRTRHDSADRCIVIRVSDTGTGIAPENLAKVCEPFFSTKGVYGSGLGLSMVYGFARQSGGDFSITSELGKGTCIEVRMPSARARADAIQVPC